MENSRRKKNRFLSFSTNKKRMAAFTVPGHIEPKKEASEPKIFLVCYDDSGPARAAVEHAACLASAARKDEIHVLAISANHDPEETEEKAKILGGASALSLLYNAQVKPHLHNEVHPDAKQAILEQAEKLNADYLVCGSRGSGSPGVLTTLSKKVFGSVSNHLLKTSTIPVIVVRNNAKKEE
jgi:nucleotide-binding universal stress UspA family protein